MVKVRVRHTEEPHAKPSFFAALSANSSKVVQCRRVKLAILVTAINDAQFSIWKLDQNMIAMADVVYRHPQL
jgi:hypothetical protein